MIEQIESVGLHTVKLGGKPFSSFVANLDGREDPYRRLSADQLDELFGTEMSKIVSPEEDVVKAVNEARRGTELWHLFLVGSFFLLGAETWIGRIKEA